MEETGEVVFLVLWYAEHRVLQHPLTVQTATDLWRSVERDRKKYKEHLFFPPIPSSLNFMPLSLSFFYSTTSLPPSSFLSLSLSNSPIHFLRPSLHLFLSSLSLSLSLPLSLSVSITPFHLPCGSTTLQRTCKRWLLEAVIRREAFFHQPLPIRSEFSEEERGILEPGWEVVQLTGGHREAAVGDSDRVSCNHVHGGAFFWNSCANCRPRVVRGGTSCLRKGEREGGREGERVLVNSIQYT